MKCFKRARVYLIQRHQGNVISVPARYQIEGTGTGTGTGAGTGPGTGTGTGPGTGLQEVEVEDRHWEG